MAHTPPCGGQQLYVIGVNYRNEVLELYVCFFSDEVALISFLWTTTLVYLELIWYTNFLKLGIFACCIAQPNPKDLNPIEHVWDPFNLKGKLRLAFPLREISVPENSIRSGSNYYRDSNFTISRMNSSQKCVQKRKENFIYRVSYLHIFPTYYLKLKREIANTNYHHSIQKIKEKKKKKNCTIHGLNGAP